MPWKLGDKIIREGRSWSADGITHPTNWAIWSDADKKAAGLDIIYIYIHIYARSLMQSPIMPLAPI